ncbi:MAG: HEAT repeat domain-containing protein, partial [Anaerolineae bacterium]|nr:HEAT repeat domain-containing protein [Anaerolineae bacterium]
LKALNFLLTLAHHENDELRASVMTGLSYYQDARVIETLTNALTDIDPSVRDGAAFYLQRMGRY